jgi:hypothetical protein
MSFDIGSPPSESKLPWRVSRGSPREELFADETYVHALTHDDEHLVGAGGARAPLGFVVGGHVGRQSS